MVSGYFGADVGSEMTAGPLEAPAKWTLPLPGQGGEEEGLCHAWELYRTLLASGLGGSSCTCDPTAFTPLSAFCSESHCLHPARPQSCPSTPVLSPAVCGSRETALAAFSYGQPSVDLESFNASLFPPVCLSEFPGLPCQECWAWLMFPPYNPDILLLSIYVWFWDFLFIWRLNLKFNVKHLNVISNNISEILNTSLLMKTLKFSDKSGSYSLNYCSTEWDGALTEWDG